jgi:hypothetical protein
MRAGLIPIVSENCGTEFPCAITCEEISIEYIKNIVSKTLELTENQIEEKSKNICSMADNMYSLPAFAISIKKAIVKSTNIISK